MTDKNQGQQVQVQAASKESQLAGKNHPRRISDCSTKHRSSDTVNPKETQNYW